ncbi:MAG: hypothetical protein KTR30_12885 [Saprospiraceae bacterium]|nr:hypothetical protein [Saprospiraceae bacterium]
MKSLKLLIPLLLCLPHVLSAQYSIPEKRQTSIFIEFLGNGILSSANIEIMAKKGSTSGWAFRAGIGGAGVDGFADDGERFSAGLITLPLQATYIVGERRSAFEAGFGLTPLYVNANVDGDFGNGRETIRGRGFGTLAFLNMGYRLKPLKNGFLLKINWTPAISNAGFYPSWFGLSLGYSFR